MKSEQDIAGAFARNAATIITEERGQQHGDAELSFSMISEWWSTYIRHKMMVTGAKVPNLDAVDVLEMMALLKKARGLYGSKNPDHSIDDIGYTSLAGGLRLRELVNERIRQQAEVQAKGEVAVAGALEPIPEFLREPKETNTDQKES